MEKQDRGDGTETPEEMRSLSLLRALLEPWWQSLTNPHKSQREVLSKLLEGYRKTEYGQRFSADRISTIEEFQNAFPVVTYWGLKPLMERVIEGDYSALLPEPPKEWGMTRGTTGEPKLIPMTATDLKQKTTCGARGLLNYVARTQKVEILRGFDLNVGFPSRVGWRAVGESQITYGYTSGIFTKYNAREARLRLVPEQEELDSLGGGIRQKDWERRFELIYQRARDKNVTMLIGVTPVMIELAQYLRRHHRVYPRDVWHLDVICATSVPFIQTRYRLALKALYGDCQIVEIYGGTEGMYGQQLDSRPFITPNYDTYLFEVLTHQGIKLLCDLRPGEYGSLIFSSVLFPRYRMGDLIRCVLPNYFQVIGRERPFTLLRYWLARLFES